MQTSSRSCPNCGTPLAEGQRFCTNCGFVMDDGTNRPTRLSINEETLPSSGSEISTRMTPPPPPPEPYNAFTQYPSSQSTPEYQPVPPPPDYQPIQSAPSYTPPQKDSSRSVMRQFGCIFLVVILLIVGACGGVGYFVYNGLRTASMNVSKNISRATGDTGSTSGSGDVTPTLGPATTSPVDATVIYSGVTLTIVDVKQAASFSDDSSTTSENSGFVRLDLKEQNNSTKGVYYYYANSFRLLLPNGNSVAPANALHGDAPDAAVSRDNWVDFPASTDIKADQMTLRLGTDTEAQIDVPLKAKADVSKYQPKTVQPNKSTQYAGLNWTLTSAIHSWSASNEQAKKGMRYVTVNLKVDNPTTEHVYSYPANALRLKAGDVTTSPSDFTLPGDYPASSSNIIGNAVFLVPQNVTSFTLVFLADSSSNISQSTIDFQFS